LILRASAYKSTLLPNEIFMPAYVEDLGRVHGVVPQKKEGKPTVGFVGKAGFASMKEQLKYLVRNYIVRRGVGREGVYFRRLAMRTLEKDPRVELQVIMRKAFGAHKSTIELSPEQARKDYVENIKNSLFTLSPRGDGNFSLRFYETLSLGRIPLLIDTDIPLPLEDTINYDEFVVRVPWQDVERIGDYVVAFFNQSEEEIVRRQALAREAFEKHLYMPRFLETVFNKERIEHLLHA
jgi:Exostosin family